MHSEEHGMKKKMDCYYMFCFVPMDMQQNLEHSTRDCWMNKKTTLQPFDICSLKTFDHRFDIVQMLVRCCVRANEFTKQLSIDLQAC